MSDEININNNNNRNGAILIILIILIVGALCFFAGRSTVKKKTEIITRYEKGDTVKITKDSLVPVYTVRPIDTTNVLLAAIKSGKFNDLFPVRDSIVYVTPQDTSLALIDWATERVYNETLFDIDTVGTETVNLKVQYNRLQEINGFFVPVIKNVQTTEIYTKKFSPFIGCGVTTNSQAMANAGLFFEDKYGVSLLFLRDFENKKNAAGLTVMYKF